MSLSIRAVGQASKRGLIRRVPEPDRLAADLDAWLRADYADTLRSASCRRAADGGVELVADLHPAAPPVVIAIAEGGGVVARAETSHVGPGYHTFVCRVLERAGVELDIVWTPPGEPDGTTDDAGFFGSGDRRMAEQAHLAWLRRALEKAHESRRRGMSGLHLSTPAGVRYTFEGALATPLGPRDDAWLEQAVSDPRVAVDVWPWLADAMDARYLLDRALSLMWLHVRWRPPGLPGEVALLDETLGLLRRAYPLEPTLPYPWRAWDELLRLRGTLDPATRQLLDTKLRSAPPGPPGPPIGYRRDEVTVVHGGWRLPVPGSFAERIEDGEWWGGEHGRQVTFAGTETGDDHGPMRPEAFLARFAGHLGDGAMTHRDGEVTGRARIDTDASSGVEVGVLEGYSAVAGRGAAMRIVFDDPDDWQWALDTWRSLRPA